MEAPYTTEIRDLRVGRCRLRVEAAGSHRPFRVVAEDSGTTGEGTGTVTVA